MPPRLEQAVDVEAGCALELTTLVPLPLHCLHADSFDPEEFYCSVGIVADIPAFADRPTLSAEAVAWAGRPE